jgi:hypothetical protein
MSRGLGVIQRRVMAAFQADPGKPFTIGELAIVTFPSISIERKHQVSVRRALRNLSEINLHLSRAGEFGSRGWRYLVRHKG